MASSSSSSSTLIRPEKGTTHDSYNNNNNNTNVGENTQNAMQMKETQGFVGNKIEFPEIEPVRDEDEIARSRVGIGKKRFTNLAVKVMAQLSLNKKDEEEGQDKDADSNASKPKVKKPSRANSRNKFASLVRLARYKRMANRHLEKQQTPTEETPRVEEKIELPEKPRFGAMLSPEAQYAMLKGYEDLLLTGLKTDKKKRDKQTGPQQPAIQHANTTTPQVPSIHISPSDINSQSQASVAPPTQALAPTQAPVQSNTPCVLYRVKTPHRNVVSLHLNGLEQKCAISEEEEEERVKPEVTQCTPQPSLQPRRQTWEVRPIPYYGQLYRTDSKDENSGSNGHSSKSKHKKENMNKSLLPRVNTIQLDSRDKIIPKDRQLLLTHRFHCAMDILDKMRESQGLVVTSPRYKRRSINPPDNYNAWSREWSREFKLEYQIK